MHTLKVEFILSAFRPDQFLTRDLPELAFAGRSNVGKSSLINVLLGQKQVARVSSTPGRTQSINFFQVNKDWVFADLPGYGYAKAPAALREHWKGLVESYLVGRTALQGIVLIVDVRREPMASDLRLKEFLVAHQIPFLPVATKIDKLSRQQVDKSIAALARAMNVPSHAFVRFSARTRDGRPELWKEIQTIMIEGTERMRMVRIEKESENRLRNASDVKAPPKDNQQ